MNSFEITFRELRKGNALIDASEELAKLVAAVREHNKAGELTIKLTVKPIDGNSDQVVVSDLIKAKVPEGIKPGTMLFTTEENLLQRDDPNQKMLDLREVEKPTQPLREAAQQ